MESAFAWLGQIFEWMGRFLPRWEIITTAEGWIKWVGGAKVKTGGAGIVFYWPARTVFKKLNVVRDSINCNAQTLTLPSGETILVEAVVIYRIIDLGKLAATSEPFSTIADETMGAVLYALEGYDSWEAIRAASVRQHRQRDSDFNRRMREEVQRTLATYGVDVLAVNLQNKAKCRVLKLVNSQES